ncbi:hypothetical protein BC830DRAFT_697865 [Chytriomyces sp. MP71]|nr:hypothetical protein BC830DRAFT_697865 [Chytriomyces sp. MP71]
MGRRKSWIVPIQIAVGVLLVAFCDVVEGHATQSSGADHSHADDTIFHCNLSRRHSRYCCRWYVSYVLLLLRFLIDCRQLGWALTMLSETNRGLVSTCQSMGQNIGIFMSYTIFLALSIADFCNCWIRTVKSPVGITTLSSYIHVWVIWRCLKFIICLLLTDSQGWIMIISTVMMWIFKWETLETIK